MIRTAALAAALVTAACAADVRSPDPREPGDPMHPTQPTQTARVTLTPAAPKQDVAMVPLPAAPTTLTLTIAAIDNPAAQGFSLGASVVWSAAGAAPVEEAIGSVTPYPPSQSGNYQLGVPEAARKALSRADGQLSLRVSLQPIATDRALAEPLRVTLGDAAWR